jgi:hypothetical protein
MAIYVYAQDFCGIIFHFLNHKDKYLCLPKMICHPCLVALFLGFFALLLPSAFFTLKVTSCASSEKLTLTALVTASTPSLVAALLNKAGFSKRSGTPIYELVYVLVLWVWLKKDSLW